MNFPTTGATTGLPAWPQASAFAPALPVTAGDGFALAIDGAMALLAGADAPEMSLASATPLVVNPRGVPNAAAFPVSPQLPTASPIVTGNAADRISRLLSTSALATPPREVSASIRPVATLVPALPANVAEPIPVPSKRAVALPMLVRTHADPVPLETADAVMPTHAAATRERSVQSITPDTALVEVAAPQSALPTRPLPIATKAVVEPIAAKPADSSPSPEAPAVVKPIDTTIPIAPKRLTPNDTAIKAATIEVAPEATAPAVSPRGSVGRAAPDQSTPASEVNVVAATTDRPVTAAPAQRHPPAPQPESAVPIAAPTKTARPPVAAAAVTPSATSSVPDAALVSAAPVASARPEDGNNIRRGIADAKEVPPHVAAGSTPQSPALADEVASTPLQLTDTALPTAAATKAKTSDHHPHRPRRNLAPLLSHHQLRLYRPQD